MQSVNSLGSILFTFNRLLQYRNTLFGQNQNMSNGRIKRYSLLTDPEPRICRHMLVTGSYKVGEAGCGCAWISLLLYMN